MEQKSDKKPKRTQHKIISAISHDLTMITHFHCFNSLPIGREDPGLQVLLTASFLEVTGVQSSPGCPGHLWLCHMAITICLG